MWTQATPPDPWIYQTLVQVHRGIPRTVDIVVGFLHGILVHWLDLVAPSADARNGMALLPRRFSIPTMCWAQPSCCWLNVWQIPSIFWWLLDTCWFRFEPALILIPTCDISILEFWDMSDLSTLLGTPIQAEDSLYLGMFSRAGLDLAPKAYVWWLLIVSP